MPYKDKQRRKQYMDGYNEKRRYPMSQHDYYVQNKDHILANAKEYYETNKEDIARKLRDKRKNNPEFFRNYYAELHRSNPSKRMVNSARARARKAGVAFDLCAEDVIIPQFCPVLGIALEYAEGYAGPASPTLDRVVPAQGYVKGNVRVISWRANRLKSDGTAEEFDRIAAYIRGEL